ncbi:hypothetical protein P7K49_033651 [Saguinus oedipus]|uniref:Uncharacterized protein n=1 Tax=Saguinus oedipus TaxID=9490 RepID=A0ABQ9TSX5_SAGOE|nr:hypothetical protein P7K49_033651 [Saguinus oedipus]
MLIPQRYGKRDFMPQRRRAEGPQSQPFSMMLGELTSSACPHESWLSWPGSQPRWLTVYPHPPAGDQALVNNRSIHSQHHTCMRVTLHIGHIKTLTNMGTKTNSCPNHRAETHLVDTFLGHLQAEPYRHVKQWENKNPKPGETELAERCGKHRDAD